MDTEGPSEITPLLCQNCNHSLVEFERQSQGESIYHGGQDSYIHTRSPQVSLLNRSKNHVEGLATLATDKKMSDPRRTFCLVTTFDVLLTGILWLIEVGSSSNNSKNKMFFDLLQEQVTAYTIQASLFDIVMIACVRFMFLIFWYGLFRVRHWWPVAVSTSLSDAALIAKIILIFMNVGSQSLDVPTTVVCILTNFILTWVEVWIIDFKVLPAESKIAKRATQEFLQQSFLSAPSIVENREIRCLSECGTQSHLEFRSFYTPAATPAPSEVGSIYGGQIRSSLPSHCCLPHQLTSEEAKIVQVGREGLCQFWEMYQDTERWEVVKVVGNGDVVSTSESAEYGKSFKIEAHINGIPPDVIFTEILLQPEDLPSWNKAVAEVKILKRVGNHTFVSLEVSAPVAMGLIRSREFVTVRHVEKRGSHYIGTGISTDCCDNLVPKSNYIRGVNGPTGFVVYPDPTDRSSSYFVWILNTDLKGNLSRTLVNRNLTQTMIDFVAAMKVRLQKA